MTGMLVRSGAGHDKGKLYLVVREEGDMLWLADGTIRPLQRPKKKKRRHVRPEEQGFPREETERFFQNPAWADNRIRERIHMAEKMR